MIQLRFDGCSTTTPIRRRIEDFESYSCKRRLIPLSACNLEQELLTLSTACIMCNSASYPERMGSEWRLTYRLHQWGRGWRSASAPRSHRPPLAWTMYDCNTISSWRFQLPLSILYSAVDRNNNNRIYTALYGRNFRGAVGVIAAYVLT